MVSDLRIGATFDDRTRETVAICALCEWRTGANWWSILLQTVLMLERRTRPSRGEIDEAALALLARHGAQILATARRYAANPDDAEDAYQRGLEILLTKAPTTREEELVPWLKTVVKHEAFALRRQRERLTPVTGDGEPVEHGSGATTTHEQAEHYERLSQSAEALSSLKPQEIRCLVLRAQGLSYREICNVTGFTYTKVNRCLTEGRQALSGRLAGIEGGIECARLAPLLSALADGEADAAALARLRPHLKTCLSCRARLREFRAAPARVAVGLWGADSARDAVGTSGAPDPVGAGAAHDPLGTSAAPGRLEALADAAHRKAEALADAAHRKAEALTDAAHRKGDALLGAAQQRAETFADAAHRKGEALLGAAQHKSAALSERAYAAAELVTAQKVAAVAASAAALAGGGAAVDQLANHQGPPLSQVQQEQPATAPPEQAPTGQAPTAPAPLHEQPVAPLPTAEPTPAPQPDPPPPPDPANEFEVARSGSAPPTASADAAQLDPAPAPSPRAPPTSGSARGHAEFAP